MIARLNDYEIKLAKLKGEFVWHTHDDTDELFLVIEGRLTIQLRDGDVTPRARASLRRPARRRALPDHRRRRGGMLIEPAGVVNTGSAGGELTATYDDSLLD